MKRFYIAVLSGVLFLSFFFPWEKSDEFFGNNVLGIVLGMVFVFFGGSYPHLLKAILFVSVGLSMLFVLGCSLTIMFRSIRKLPTFRRRVLVFAVGTVVLLIVYLLSGKTFFSSVAWGVYVTYGSVLLLVILGKDRVVGKENSPNNNTNAS